MKNCLKCFNLKSLDDVSPSEMEIFEEMFNDINSDSGYCKVLSTVIANPDVLHECSHHNVNYDALKQAMLAELVASTQNSEAIISV